MILLLDIGNTRIKWAQLEGRGLSAQSAAAYTEVRSELFDAVLQDLAKPSRIVVSNVGGEAIAAACTQVFQRRFSLTPEFLVSQSSQAGVTNAYREPAKLGVDRWLAMIAAFAKKRHPVCVVSVGTALTIDVVEGLGKHLGGVIAPGPNLMRETLLRNTSDIAPRMTPAAPAASLFADHTHAAVENGCRYALAALIDRAYRDACDRVSPKPHLLITGGAAAALLPLIEAPYEVVDDLVLQGMAGLVGVDVV